MPKEIRLESLIKLPGGLVIGGEPKAASVDSSEEDKVPPFPANSLNLVPTSFIERLSAQLPSGDFEKDLRKFDELDAWLHSLQGLQKQAEHLNRGKEQPAELKTSALTLKLVRDILKVDSYGPTKPKLTLSRTSVGVYLNLTEELEKAEAKLQSAQTLLHAYLSQYQSEASAKQAEFVEVNELLVHAGDAIFSHEPENGIVQQHLNLSIFIIETLKRLEAIISKIETPSNKLGPTAVESIKAAYDELIPTVPSSLLRIADHLAEQQQSFLAYLRNRQADMQTGLSALQQVQKSLRTVAKKVYYLPEEIFMGLSGVKKTLDAAEENLLALVLPDEKESATKGTSRQLLPVHQALDAIAKSIAKLPSLLKSVQEDIVLSLEQQKNKAQKDILTFEQASAELMKVPQDEHANAETRALEAAFLPVNETLERLNKQVDDITLPEAKIQPSEILRVAEQINKAHDELAIRKPAITEQERVLFDLQGQLHQVLDKRYQEANNRHHKLAEDLKGLEALAKACDGTELAIKGVNATEQTPIQVVQAAEIALGQANRALREAEEHLKALDANAFHGEVLANAQKSIAAAEDRLQSAELGFEKVEPVLLQALDVLVAEASQGKTEEEQAELQALVLPLRQRRDGSKVDLAEVAKALSDALANLGTKIKSEFNAFRIRQAETYGVAYSPIIEKGTGDLLTYHYHYANRVTDEDKQPMSAYLNEQNLAVARESYEIILKAAQTVDDKKDTTTGHRSPRKAIVLEEQVITVDKAKHECTLTGDDIPQHALKLAVEALCYTHKQPVPYQIRASAASSKDTVVAANTVILRDVCAIEVDQEPEHYDKAMRKAIFAAVDGGVLPVVKADDLQKALEYYQNHGQVTEKNMRFQGNLVSLIEQYDKKYVKDSSSSIHMKIEKVYQSLYQKTDAPSVSSEPSLAASSAKLFPGSSSIAAHPLSVGFLDDYRALLVPDVRKDLPVKVNHQQSSTILQATAPDTVSKPTMRNNDCAETMLIAAAKKVGGVDLQFTYPGAVSDTQVDLGPALVLAPDEEKMHWDSGKAKEALEADLKRLNKSKVYFLRTGTNGGAGHWQMLYFDQAQQGWFNQAHQTKPPYCVSVSDKLTEEGECLLTPNKAWGKGYDERSFLLVEASPQTIVNAANYLHDFRLHGEKQAIANTHKNAADHRSTFYDGVVLTSSTSASKGFVP